MLSHESFGCDQETLYKICQNLRTTYFYLKYNFILFVSVFSLLTVYICILTLTYNIICPVREINYTLVNNFPFIL